MEVKRRTAKALVGKLSSVSEQTRTESLCELRLISKNDPESRSLIAEAGAIPYLSEILYSPSAIAQENATATLLNISISTREPLMSTRGLLDALSHALRNPESASTAQSAAATVFSLLTVDSYRPIIGSKRDILYALIDMIRNSGSHPRSIKDALKALFGVSLYPLNRATVIELGAVPALFSLVVKDGRVGVVEDATAVIAQIAGCEEAGDAFRKVSGIGVLVDLLDLSTGSSGRTKENAVSALLNMVQCGKKDVGEYVKEMASIVCNGILDVAENGSVKGKMKANQLLKLIDSSSGSSGFHEMQVANGLKTVAFSSSQLTQQTLPGYILPTGPALLQHLVHPYSQPNLPLGPFAKMIGYHFLHQSYTNVLSGFQKTFAVNSTYHQQLAAVLPRYNNCVSVSSLPRSQAAPSGYGSFWQFYCNS